MFDASRDLRIEAFSSARSAHDVTTDAGPLRLRTAGLRERGHAELEVQAVPPAMLVPARRLLCLAAESAVDRAPLRVGQRWSVQLPAGFVVVALAEGSSSVLRLLDPEANDFDDPAKTAISAVAVDGARALRARQPAAALEMLQDTLEWHAGADAESDADDAQLRNQGNSLAYLTQADWLDDDDAYRTALERSPALVALELGGPPPPRVSWPRLLVEVRALVLALQAAPRSERLHVASPALRLDGGRLVQPLVPAAPHVLGYFYEGVAADRLRDASVHALVAEIYDRAYAIPLPALVASRATVRGHYLGGYRFELPLRSRPFEYASALEDASPVPLLTRVLATVGRELAAGLSIPECRARWGLDPASDTLQVAASKLQRLLAAEAETHWA